MAACCGLVLFATAPQWRLGRFPELRWAAWQQAIGSSHVFFAALVLLLSACGQLIPRTPAAGAAADPGPSPLSVTKLAGDRWTYARPAR